MSSRKKKKAHRGYGNIYTPHAGSMIINVQRESGLANRTIVLSPRRVRLLRFALSRIGLFLIAIFAISWILLAIQVTRLPVLNRRLADMQRDAQRLDTLQLKLAVLQSRYEQVQKMLGAAPATPAPTPSVPSLWPLESAGFVTRGSEGPSDYSGPHPGVDIATPTGSDVRASGGGSVVEVGENPEYGTFIRLSHPNGYETLYGHLSKVLVHTGDQVGAGTVIAKSGNTGRSTAPHLHFEVRLRGQAVDPLQLIKKEP